MLRNSLQHECDGAGYVQGKQYEHVKADSHKSYIQCMHHGHEIVCRQVHTCIIRIYMYNNIRPSMHFCIVWTSGPYALTQCSLLKVLRGTEQLTLKPALPSHPLFLAILSKAATTVLVYRARPSLPRVILLSHALNYKRVWRGGREGLAEVISIHSLFS